MSIDELRALIREGWNLLDHPHFTERLDEREVTEEQAIDVALTGTVVEERPGNRFKLAKRIDVGGGRTEPLQVVVWPVKHDRQHYAFFCTVIWPWRPS